MISRRFNCDLEGCRVLLRMSAGDVEGTVHGVNENNSRLSLVGVTDLDSGKPVHGILHFYDRDIASCVVLDNTRRKEKVIGQNEDGPRLLRVRPLPPHLERLNASVNSCEFICRRMEGDNNSEEVIKKGVIELMGPPDTLPKLQQPLAAQFEVIDQVDDRFNKAMAAVRNAHSISIGFEGPKVSRHGPISVLAVATSKKVFIFDVMNLKEQLFTRGLKEVLESNDIEKVIHDCRHLSDCLYYQYKVDLNNVFDTMVADVVIYSSKRMDAWLQHLPPFVRGIQNCLRGFLNLTQEQLKYTRTRQGQQEELVSMWDQRPLTLAQIDALVKDTVFLAELARVCLKQLLLRFQHNVQLFVKFDRDSTIKELGYLPPSDILPESFREALRSGFTGRHYDNYNRDYYREHGGHGKNNEDNRFQHRRQQRWREENRFQHRGQQRWQYRGGYVEPRGARSQGDVIRGQYSGGGGELLGPLAKVDDSLMSVAMCQQERNHADKPGDTTVMANGQSSIGTQGAANGGHGGSNALSGVNRFGDSAGERSVQGSKDDSPVHSGGRTEEKRSIKVHVNNEDVAPDDMLMFVAMSAAAASAVQETAMDAADNGDLLMMGADSGEEVFQTSQRERQPASPDVLAEVTPGSPGASPNGWGTRPMEDEEMSFRPADMRVTKYPG